MTADATVAGSVHLSPRPPAEPARAGLELLRALLRSRQLLLQLGDVRRGTAARRHRLQPLDLRQSLLQRVLLRPATVCTALWKCSMSDESIPCGGLLLPPGDQELAAVALFRGMEIA